MVNKLNKYLYKFGNTTNITQKEIYSQKIKYYGGALNDLVDNIHTKLNDTLELIRQIKNNSVIREQNISQLEKELNEHESICQTDKIQLNTSIDQLNKTIRTCTSSSSTCTEQVKEYENEIAKLQQDINVITARNAELNKKLVEYKQKIPLISQPSIKQEPEEELGETLEGVILDNDVILNKKKATLRSAISTFVAKLSKLNKDIKAGKIPTSTDKNIYYDKIATLQEKIIQQIQKIDATNTIKDFGKLKFELHDIVNEFRAFMSSNEIPMNELPNFVGGSKKHILKWIF